MGRVSIIQRNRKGFTGGLRLDDPGKLFREHPGAADRYVAECLRIAKQDRHDVVEYVRVFYEAALDAVVEAAQDSGAGVGTAKLGTRPDTFLARMQTARPKKLRISPSRAAVQRGAPATLTIRTKPWATLGVRYQLSDPVSRRYWNKTGRLWKELQASLPKGRVSMSVVEPSLVKRRLPRRKGDGGEIRFKYRISLPRLPWPLSEMVTESFVQGTPVRASRHPAAPDDLTRLVFVEGRRPMVSAIAARTGEELIKALTPRTRISAS